MEIPQLICCGVSMKSEITRDYAAACARGPRASLNTALTVTSRTRDPAEVQGDAGVRRR